MALSGIKGITIEFRANTSAVSTALTKINKETRSVESQLKQVNAALKFNPRNAELLAQKHSLLKEKVNGVQERLKVLNQTQKAMDAKGVDKASREYQELRREIIVTESKLKRFSAESRKAAAAASSIGRAGASMQSMGGKLKTAGQNMTMVSAGAAMIGGAAIRTTAEFDTAMSKVQAVSGATGADFEKLRNKAREMGASTKFSASESAEALNYMAMAGWKTDDMLDGLSGVMNLAAASGEDLATTSDIVTDALTAFGMQASDSQHFADILAAASSNANTNVSMMGETFKYAAPVAGALGFSAEDTAQAIGLMANAGIKSSQAGTSLRSVMTNLSKDFTISGKAIGDVTIQTQNADGSMRSLNDILEDSRAAFSELSESEKTSAAQSLVGKNAMSGFLALMNSSDKDIDKLETALTNCDGASEKMAETMQNNLGGKVTNLKSKMSELGIAVGDSLVPVIDKLVGAVSTVVDWFNNLSPRAQTIMSIILMVVAITGPLLIIIGTMAGAIGAIINVVSMLTPVLFGAAAAETAATIPLLPIIGIIAAIIAIIIAVIVVVKNWSKITTAVKNVISKAMDGIRNAFGKLKSIAGTVAGVFNSVKSKMLAPIETAKNRIKSAIDRIKNIINNAKLRLPKFKLPHFKISGGKVPWGIGGKGTKPTVDVDWYAKGGIFNKPNVIGVGEAGPEAVLPIEKLQIMFNSMADSIVNGVGMMVATNSGSVAPAGDIVITNYLYPSGPEMGKQVVKMYDVYKRRLG